jgi:copper ion binding protein
MKTTLIVQGMTCNHCVMSVTRALRALDGVTSVEVDLQTKRVEVEHEASVERARLGAAIEAVGFEVSGPA